ncbi:MAG TPA: DUF3306 domain-containing protein [Rhizomicrobium sp.]
MVEEPASPPATDASPQATSDTTPKEKPAGERSAGGAAAKTAGEGAAPAFDPASLPSIDSITAQSDIAAFLKPGVPGELRLAALRRAWVTDPAIRNFKGLADYDWDFTVPNEAMGFGEIDPGLDVKKMLTDVFGEARRAGPPETELPAAAEQLPPSSQELRPESERGALDAPDDSARVASSVAPTGNDSPDAGEMVQSSNNGALQGGDAASDDTPIRRRRPQGGALPQ